MLARSKIAVGVLTLLVCVGFVAYFIGGCGPHGPKTFNASFGTRLGKANFGQPKLRILYYGDFGDPTPQRDETAAAMIAAHRKTPFDFGIAVGDNIYPCGPDLDLPNASACKFERDESSVAMTYEPPADRRFDERFHEPLAELRDRAGKPLRVQHVLGNHDVGLAGNCLSFGRERAIRSMRTKACLEVAHRKGGWSMPGRHYVVDDDVARFIFFDGNVIEFGDYAGFTVDAEVAFVKEAVAGCGERLCFLVTHQPPYTAGIHKGEAASDAYQARVKRFEAAGRIDAWFAGHDHDLQHSRAARGGYDVFVSGNTARGRDERFNGTSHKDAPLLFASSQWGFATILIDKDRWGVRFENTKNESLYCCQSSEKGKRCEPVQCE